MLFDTHAHLDDRRFDADPGRASGPAAGARGLGF